MAQIASAIDGVFDWLKFGCGSAAQVPSATQLRAFGLSSSSAVEDPSNFFRSKIFKVSSNLCYAPEAHFGCPDLLAFFVLFSSMHLLLNN